MATGNPAFDGIDTTEMREKGSRWRAERGISRSEKVILWASNVEPEKHPFTGTLGDPYLPDRVEHELRRIVKERCNWHLVVRYHPSEQKKFMPGMRTILSPRSEDLHPLLHASDVAVVMVSTVGLEASIAGTPVVTVDKSVFTADAPYSSFGLATGVNDIADLACAIQECALKTSRAGIQETTALQAVYQQIRSILD